MFRDYAFKTDTIFLSSQWVNWMSCFFRFLATKSSVILSKCEWVGDRPSTFWWRPQPEQVTSSPWSAGQHRPQPWWESQTTLKLTLSMLNCLAEIGYEKIHQHLLSFLDTDMVQIVHFFPRGRQGPVYHTLSIQCKPDISRSRISRNWIYRGRMLDPIFWRPRARYFSRNRGNSLDPIRGGQFFAKSAHRDSFCSRFAGDNFSRNQLKPTCQCKLEHMLCDGQPR